MTDEYRSAALPSSVKVPLVSAVTVSVGMSLTCDTVIVADACTVWPPWTAFMVMVVAATSSSSGGSFFFFVEQGEF